MTKIRCVTCFSCKALGGFSLHLTFGECETWRRLEALLTLADGGIPCGGCGGGVLACDGPTRVKTLDSFQGHAAEQQVPFLLLSEDTLGKHAALLAQETPLWSPP